MAGVLLDRSRTEASPAGEIRPHRWALSPLARSFRRLGRPFIINRHVRRFCSPLTIEGREHLEELPAPALIIANHTSHFDTVLVLSLLPARLYSRTAVTAAGDRFYTQRVKAAWYSLRYNAYPITRGGGRAALDYSEWLLQNKWSLLIFPEGHRSRTGDLLPFHAGPAILALRQRVPVLPIHVAGAIDILPAGNRRSRPAAVGVRIGAPLSLDGLDDIGEATARMEDAVRSLAPREVERTVV
jgi:1-acyl-sn-glycerol-3-phosphate acyltransferase